ncbi:TIGR03767 family metallophosphoesterase, partial [Streptomyces scabiei]|nr:TIGR03767 family metallophosphoesterase [Streptomyces scabiei]
MPRIRSVAAAATHPDRRAFLAATGAVGLAAGAGFALRPETAAHAATSAAATGEIPLTNLSSRQAPA